MLSKLNEIWEWNYFPFFIINIYVQLGFIVHCYEKNSCKNQTKLEMLQNGDSILKLSIAELVLARLYGSVNFS